jgi:[acyl-carrier-protein] S-malonyltransferase
MGRDLYDSFPSVREIYERANKVLGFDIASLSFNGPEEDLRETRNAQVAILIHSIAADMLLKNAGVTPDIVAGHSLGEYSANVSAGSLEFDDALHVVRFRGELMWQSGLERPGTMAAILGMDRKDVELICKEASAQGIVAVANYNSPDQVVISGEPVAVEAASKMAISRGAKKAIPLKVSGAFHSELMREAAEKLSKVLSKTKISDPRVPVVANWSGRAVKDSRSVADALSRQMLSPVLWVDSMRTILESKAECFVEAGPGKVLTRLLKKINPEVPVYNVGDRQSLESVARTIKQGVSG